MYSFSRVMTDRWCLLSKAAGGEDTPEVAEALTYLENCPEDNRPGLIVFIYGPGCFRGGVTPLGVAERCLRTPNVVRWDVAERLLPRGSTPPAADAQIAALLTDVRKVYRTGKSVIVESAFLSRPLISQLLQEAQRDGSLRAIPVLVPYPVPAAGAAAAASAARIYGAGRAVTAEDVLRMNDAISPSSEPASATCTEVPRGQQLEEIGAPSAALQFEALFAKAVREAIVAWHRSCKHWVK